MRARLKTVSVLATFGLIAGLLGGVPAGADHDPQDDHSKNFKKLARVPIKIDKDLFAQGSDLAFKKKLLIAGSYEGTGIYKILRRKPFIKQLSFIPCAGGQGDVSIHRNVVIVSVDSPRVGPSCKFEDSAPASQDVHVAGEAWEGLRFISIRNPRRPKYIGAVDMPCGSHTHTLLPRKRKSLIYIESYPLGAQGQDCSIASHRKIQIVQFPNSNPAQAKLLNKTIDISPMIGCHDVTTFPKKGIMFGACVNQSFIWDISGDPTEPELLSTIENPNIQIHHSTAMTWDGKYLVLGDEYAGATGPGGCDGDEDSTVGAAWFYDITDPSNPVEVGHHALPRIPAGADNPDEAQRFRCTNHNFNVIPMKDKKKYWLAVSYYMGGIAVVDFSDPSDPTEIGHYVTSPGGINQDTWSAYWYNGRIYTNDHISRFGVGVYRFKGTGRRKAHFFRKTGLNPKGEMNPQVQIKNW